jgi:hypothetical protein
MGFDQKGIGLCVTLGIAANGKFRRGFEKPLATFETLIAEEYARDLAGPEGSTVKPTTRQTRPVDGRVRGSDMKRRIQRYKLATAKRATIGIGRLRGRLRHLLSASSHRGGAAMPKTCVRGKVKAARCRRAATTPHVI